MTLSHPRAALRAAAFLLVTGGLLPLYLLAFPFGARARRLFAWPFFRNSLFLTGLSIQTTGKRTADPGVLYVANHASYLDIPVLGALTDGIFVAKAEVKGWPLFGLLANIGRTVFVSRRPENLRREQAVIAGRLARGESVFLFPEGSSSNGAGVLPFRAGLMAAASRANGGAVRVQPVSIVYGPQSAARPGLTRAERDRYAWYGHMEMLPHLWRLFGTGEKIAVAVEFHPPRRAGEFTSARALTQWAEQTVAQGMRRAYLAAVQSRENTSAAVQFVESDFSF